MAEDQVLRGTKRKHPADGTEASCNEPYSSAVRKIDQERCHYEDPGLTNGNYCTGKQHSSEYTKGQHLQLLSHTHGDPIPDSLNSGRQRDKSLTKEEDTEVCFGSICDIHARFIDTPPSDCNYLSANALESDEEKLEVLLGSEYCVICSPLRDGIIGFINLGVSNTLKRLFEIEGTRLETSLSLSEWKSGTQRHSSIAWETNVEIAIFGARKNAFLVGDCLSSGTLFLQDPKISCDLQYENPHRFPFVGDFKDNSDDESSEVDDNDTLSINKLVPASAKISTKRLEHILDTLHEHDYLQEVQPDKNLNISLFPHQKEAIDFKIRRETGRSTSSISLWNIQKDKNGNPHHYHAITGDSTTELSVGPLGGILADTMGLGKTVTTLSTILSTLDHSEEWVKKRTNSQVSGTKGAKATLIVVPNEELMEQWLDEIRSKFIPGTFDHCKYHGSSRKASIRTFEQFDIVLTTYGTISTEFAERESPIYQTDFFRIVLDEAHNIKSRSTRIHEAACNISADRRWCLTGTPIQNDLDDLGALVSFLRFPLLEDRGVFRKHVINQAYNTGTDPFENLRLLLGCICLRRTMSLGMLMEPTINNLKLDLAPEEREAYINILYYHNRLIDVSVSKGGSVGAFQTVLQLRIFCNNGLYRKKDIRASPTDLLTSEEYLNFWQGNHESQCPGTDSKALALGSYKLSDSKSSPETSNSISEPCRIPLQNNNTLDLAEIEGPASELLNTPNLFRESLTPDYLSLVDQSPQTLEGTFSTKHRAILKTILGHIPREKGIVFSAWTKSLDIMAELLRHHDITFARVDGSMSFSQRQQAFQSFKTSSDVNILLITIGTGAVGLNLSIATRVHIMEPSWNPMVEQQAIGRVVRLGQKRPVVITRYIMRDTVEESVVSRQDLKLDVAMSGFEGASHEGAGDDE